MAPATWSKRKSLPDGVLPASPERVFVMLRPQNTRRTSPTSEDMRSHAGLILRVRGLSNAWVILRVRGHRRQTSPTLHAGLSCRVRGQTHTTRVRGHSRQAHKGAGHVRLAKLVPSPVTQMHRRRPEKKGLMALKVCYTP